MPVTRRVRALPHTPRALVGRRMTRHSSRWDAADEHGVSPLQRSLLDLQHAAGNRAVSGLVGGVLQRAKPILDSAKLEAALWRDNSRLQAAFHNNPTLQPSDAQSDVALLQEALDRVFRAMPKSKSVIAGKTVFDGKWENETVTTVHDFPVLKDINPPGGFEAGRRTLAALDFFLPKP